MPAQHSKPAPLEPNHTRNIPLKEVLASCEVTQTWPGVLGKLTDGTPLERAPTFLEELALAGTLARK